VAIAVIPTTSLAVPHSIAQKEVHVMRIAAAVLLAILGAAVSTAFAASAPRQAAWTRVSGPTKASPQLGLLRAGRILHVVSAQGSPATISDTQLNGAGGVAHTSTITSNFDSAGGLALVGMADGSVRLFAAGGDRPGLPSNLSGINSLVSPPGASAWTLDPVALWGGAVAGAAAEIGATITGNQPVTAWSGGFVHVGLGPSAGADPSYQPDCCGIAPQLATDAATGSVVMSWLSNGHDSGTYVKQVLPSPGAMVSLPSGLTEGSSGIAARIGAPGVFVAYTGTTNQVVKLYRYGGETQTVAKGAFRVAKVFTGPGGRLWMLWGDASNGVWVTRSNKAVTRWEPVQHLALPGNLTAFYNAQGEGSAGPLDAFVDLLIGTSDRGFWRTHVLPVLSATSSTTSAASGSGGKRTAKVSFRVADAGDPVAGATIVMRLGSTVVANLRTGGDGRATTNLILGNVHGSGGKAVTARVSAPGYDNAIITVGHGA
jgi:hypothetical protein